MTPVILAIVVLIVAGTILWAINTWVPMDPKFKSLVNIVAIFGAVVWLIVKFHLLSYLK